MSGCFFLKHGVHGANSVCDLVANLMDGVADKSIL